MSVSGELLCSFELLKPLDSSALKSHIKKGRNKRNSMLNSPVSEILIVNMCNSILTKSFVACHGICPKLLKPLFIALFYERSTGRSRPLIQPQRRRSLSVSAWSQLSAEVTSRLEHRVMVGP